MEICQIRICDMVVEIGLCDIGIDEKGVLFNRVPIDFPTAKYDLGVVSSFEILLDGRKILDGVVEPITIRKTNRACFSPGYLRVKLESDNEV